jgi:hypothetical protein
LAGVGSRHTRATWGLRPRPPSVLASPALGFIEGPCPNPPVLRPGAVLLGDMLERIASVRDCPALLDHASTQVSPFNRALGYGSTPRVHISPRAPHGPGAKQVTEAKRRALATAVRLGARLADLPVFRRIDPVQPDARPTDLDGVPMNDRCATDHLACHLSGPGRGLAGGLPRLTDRVSTAFAGNAAGSSKDHGLRYVASFETVRLLQDQENCGHCKRQRESRSRCRPVDDAIAQPLR